MPKFGLENIDAVQGVQHFDKLVVNGIAPFDSFEKELQNNDRKDLQT